MNPQVSVIIPCYNAAETLERALDSVIRQSFSNWEIIVVDDGSTDDTKNVITQYDDSRIRYIRQDNRGASAARNNGINHARGEWLFFLDSDDMLLSRALEILIGAATPDVCVVLGCHQSHMEESDINVCSTYEILEAKLCASCALFYQKYGDDVRKQVFAHSKVQYELNLGAPWAKLYRREWINFHGIRFNNYLVLHEDTLFTHSVYATTSKVVVIPYPVYSYLDNKDSLTRSVSPFYIEYCISALREFENVDAQYQDDVCYFAMFRILDCWSVLHRFTRGAAKIQKLRDFRRNETIHDYIVKSSIIGNIYINIFNRIELVLLKKNCLKILISIRVIIDFFKKLARCSI